jgi:hypothetical protein
MPLHWRKSRAIPVCLFFCFVLFFFLFVNFIVCLLFVVFVCVPPPGVRYMHTTVL